MESSEERSALSVLEDRGQCSPSVSWAEGRRTLRNVTGRVLTALSLHSPVLSGSQHQLPLLRALLWQAARGGAVLLQLSPVPILESKALSQF